MARNLEQGDRVRCQTSKVERVKPVEEEKVIMQSWENAVLAKHNTKTIVFEEDEVEGRLIRMERKIPEDVGKGWCRSDLGRNMGEDAE